MRDPDTNISKGHGFVSFENTMNATTVGGGVNGAAGFNPLANYANINPQFAQANLSMAGMYPFMAAAGMNGMNAFSFANQNQFFPPALVGGKNNYQQTQRTNAICTFLSRP